MALNWVIKEQLAQRKPQREFPENFRFQDHGKVVKEGAKTIVEFIAAGGFADAFYSRQMYEVDAGRDEEPLLYNTIYDVMVNADLPKIIPINVLGPGGVVFERITEGGEVKFVSVGESTKSVTLYHYAAGIEYTDELVLFNQSWQFPIIERQFGVAHNALLNHLHFNPILAYSYAAANQTAASSTGTLLEEKYARTLEDAITNAKGDSSNPRRGPYDLLIASADMFTVDRALKLRIQDGANPNAVPAAAFIQNIIVYDGWTGTRGKKSTTYDGVTAGTGYLISKAYSEDFKGYVKLPLRNQRGDGDLSRFVVEQAMWDTWLGVYANPLRAVEEITWPTS